MKKHLGIIILMVLFIAFLISIASNNPDALDKLIENFGPTENPSFWNGIMPEYSIGTISNQYISALLAGFLGTLLVLLATFLLGKVIAIKNPKISE